MSTKPKEVSITWRQFEAECPNMRAYCDPRKKGYNCILASERCREEACPVWKEWKLEEKVRKKCQTTQ